MKKILILFLMLILFFTLTACSEEDTPETTPPATETENPSDNGEEELYLQIALADDAFLSTFDRYFVAGDLGHAIGVNLAIWSNAPLRNVSLLSLGNDLLDDEIIYIPMDTFGTVGELLPGQAFVIHSYAGLGSMPWVGIRFTDAAGAERYFVLSQNHAYPEHGDEWVIWEFENRTAELPEDWVAPWEAEDTPEEEPTENDTAGGPVGAGLQLSIGLATDAMVGEATAVHVIEHTLVGGGIGENESEAGDRLFITTNVPLFDFALTAIAIEAVEGIDEWLFLPFNAVGHIDVFSPGEVLIIHNYRNMGTLPWSGITFFEPNGRQRHFTIVQNQGPGDAYLLVEFQDRTHERSDWVAPW